ncbi:HEAT repeat domain-containing protein [Halorussus sp. MSC15.2]|uniref:HEAT repeat domain-containing protein n=1 Tax=Halorussus sp. MSC15.2 TaxID=2283638 RepID=UPI0013D3E54E|nr:HEAT repeat domain-containing protein [Halorussus sp. MSC15.2]NEU55536.1 HEAT repeat domain-containing protein [Halorussus sp. MSC15.2]
MSDKYANRSARARSPTRDGGDESDLRSLLDSPREYERRDAALALVDEAESDGLDAATASALADRLAEDDSEDVRQFAVEALGVAGGGGTEDVETAVRAALDADDDEWVRAESVVALSRIAPDADALADALGDDSGWVRRNAVIALGKTGRATPEDLTDRIKNDPHPAVREYAALYLGERAEDVEEAVRLLAAVLARDPEAFVRAKAAESLGEFATDRAEQALETHGITDRSDDVKRTAKRALASARGVDPDQLDVEIDDGPPGGGPQSRAETPNGPGPSADRPGPAPDGRRPSGGRGPKGDGPPAPGEPPN